MKITILSPQDRALQQRWKSLWANLGREAPQELFDWLLAQYSNGRVYHNLGHISSCLAELDNVRSLLKEPNAVEFALWFHDVVYETGPPEYGSGKPKGRANEEKSARLAYKAAKEAGLGEDFARSASELILVTKHAGTQSDSDAKYLADIDLSILGKPAPIFDEYDRAIKQEYSWVSPELFREKRSELLNGFLKRESVFQTRFFIERYESQAEENINRALHMLMET